MAIVFACGSCGNKVQAPDSLAGQKVRCPLCQARLDVPRPILEAEPVPALPPAPIPLFDQFTSSPPSRPAPPAPQPLRDRAPEEGDRRPCPVCGEMILTRAVKCRFCGEFLDSTLRRTAGRAWRPNDDRPIASRGSRLGAAILDGLVAMVFLLPGLILILGSLESRRNEDAAVVALGALVVGGLVLVVVQVVLLSAQGQTLGKKMVGIRIVNISDGSNPGFGGAVFMRSFVPGLIGIIPFVGSIFPLVDICWIFGEESRCLHDLIAGTCVVEA